jgi:crotonobetainyl-CoA:carnitine CoA-transferase CaiB-like acyl-CoA transferase
MLSIFMAMFIAGGSGNGEGAIIGQRSRPAYGFCAASAGGLVWLAGCPQDRPVRRAN